MTKKGTRQAFCCRGHDQSVYRRTKGKKEVPYCLLCARITHQKWAAKRSLEQPTWQAEKHLKENWGLTLNDYDEMLAAQGGGCSICGTSDFGSKRGHIDHDHKTGNIRGILCTNCNNGLGRFKDNIEYLEEAIRYLKVNNNVVKDR